MRAWTHHAAHRLEHANETDPRETRAIPACTLQNGQEGRRPCLEVSVGTLELLRMHRQHSCTSGVPRLPHGGSTILMPLSPDLCIDAGRRIQHASVCKGWQQNDCTGCLRIVKKTSAASCLKQEPTQPQSPIASQMLRKAHPHTLTRCCSRIPFCLELQAKWKLPPLLVQLPMVFSPQEVDVEETNTIHGSDLINLVK